MSSSRPTWGKALNLAVNTTSQIYTGEWNINSIDEYQAIADRLSRQFGVETPMVYAGSFNGRHAGIYRTGRPEPEIQVNILDISVLIHGLARHLLEQANPTDKVIGMRGRLPNKGRTPKKAREMLIQVIQAFRGVYDMPELDFTSAKELVASIYKAR